MLRRSRVEMDRRLLAAGGAAAVFGLGYVLGRRSGSCDDDGDDDDGCDDPLERLVRPNIRAMSGVCFCCSINKACESHDRIPARERTYKFESSVVFRVTTTTSTTQHHRKDTLVVFVNVARSRWRRTGARATITTRASCWTRTRTRSAACCAAATRRLGARPTCWR